MFNKRKFFSSLLVMMLLVSLLTACTNGDVADDPDDETPGEELVASEVLLEATQDYLKTVGTTSYIVAGNEILDLNSINPDAIMIVDMRSADAYAEGHAEGAVNIPFAEIGNNLNALPTDKDVYFVCYSGQSSAQATAVANLAGFNAYSFQGGMNFGWTEDYEQETQENALPEAVERELSEKEQIIHDKAVSYFDEGTKIVSAEDLQALVEDNPDMITVLDIRREDDYNSGHIDTAINIPYAEVGERLEEIPTNRPVYVICYSGQTAGIVAGSLRMAEYNAFSVSRGMIGCEAAEIPTVTE